MSQPPRSQAPAPALFLAANGSTFGERLRRAGDGALMELPLDVAFDGEPLRVATLPSRTEAGTGTRPAATTCLTWGDEPLVVDDRARVARVLVERPLFAWPQPWCGDVPAHSADDARAEAERLHGARSATIAALRVLASHVEVANAPSLALLAATPAVALARLAGRGVAVHPWSLGVGGEGRQTSLLGNGRWCAAPPTGAGAALHHAPFAGELRRLLVLPGACLVRDGRAPSDGADRAARAATAAARTLGLHVAAVDLVADSGAVLWLDPAPDLEAWDDATGGQVAATLAAWLAGDPVAAVEAGTPTSA